jgi:ABC-type lipoprotein export system ATPase subunit
MQPTRFQIKGLFGASDVDVQFEGPCVIIVGPNGVGKSSVANIFYYFVSRQWRRLIEYKFDRITLWFQDEAIEVAREEISGLSRISELLENMPKSSRSFELITRLRSMGKLEEFISDLTKSPRSIKNIRNYLGHDSSSEELRHLMYTIERRVSMQDDDLFSFPRKDIEARLDAFMPGRTLYLPTYRRIEKDLQEISPAFGQRFREILNADGELKLTRSSKYYVDLVNFGMGDVRARLNELTRTLRDFSLGKFNELSGHYLKDVIRGKADGFDYDQIQALGETSLSEILGRVSENVLSGDDKDLLSARISKIRNASEAQLSVQDRYLAHYFSRLMTVNDEISAREKDIIAFITCCNNYLMPLKEIVYDDTDFTVRVVDPRLGQIELSLLSSGEKQVVSLFAHLFLDSATPQTIVIDEPELSLSVPWQKRFLLDILQSERCNFLLSVTHSPFVYQNALRSSAKDLRKFMQPTLGE